MIVLKISDTKYAMRKLLYDNETAFDSFLLSEAVIKMGTTFSIDGHINPEFYSTEDIDRLRFEATQKGWIYDEKLQRWFYIKSRVLSVIKGQKTPHSFNIVFFLSNENMHKFISGLDITSGSVQPDKLMLMLKFEENTLYAITGSAYSQFTMDKSIDREWDQMVKKFFNSHGIAYEELS